VSTQIIERMAIEVDGQGEPIILIHGLGGTSNTFTPQLQVVGSRYRTVRPDLPGSGRSVQGTQKASIQGYADAIRRLAAVLGIERARFVGHSMGTIVCQYLAVQQPSLVSGLFLCGPLLAPPEAAREGLRARAQKARAEGMADIADQIVAVATSADTRSQRPLVVALVREMLMRQDPSGYADTCEALAAAEPAEIRQIRCPTVLITGDEDVVAPPSVARLMAERIEGAQAIILNRCGHWTTFERVAEVNSALAEFLTRRA